MPTMRESVDKNIYRINGELTQVRDQLKVSPYIDEDKVRLGLMFMYIFQQVVVMMFVCFGCDFSGTRWCTTRPGTLTCATGWVCARISIAWSLWWCTIVMCAYLYLHSIRRLREQIGTVRNWQALFDMDEYQFSGLVVAQKEFDSKQRYGVMLT